MPHAPANDHLDDAALRALLHVGDPLADALLDELAAEPTQATALGRGIAEGLGALREAGVSLGPALRAFLEEVERIPAWVDPAILAAGSESYLQVGDLSVSLALGPGALVHTYTAGGIARTLVGTGNLRDLAERRVLETGSWLLACLLPGGLLRGAPGYVRTLQVRVLHARVRRVLARRDPSRLAIHQLELARTWLDFTYVSFDALRRMGLTFAPGEIERLYAFWHYLAHLLGVEPALYRSVVDDASARALLERIDGVIEGVTDDSRALTQAMIAAVSRIFAQRLPMSERAAHTLVCAVLRLLHGEALADRLEVPPMRAPRLVAALVGFNRMRCAAQRRLGPVHRWARRRTLAAFHRNLAEVGATPYEQAAAQPPRDELPRSMP